jgi:Holliday junction resolvasome RuvABC DNA-binding subunit
MKDKEKILKFLDICRAEIERIMLNEIRLFIRTILKSIEQKKNDISSESDSEMNESEELINELKNLGIKPNVISTVIKGKNQKSDFFYLNDFQRKKNFDSSFNSNSFIEND